MQQQRQRQRQQQLELELWCYRLAVAGVVAGIGRGSVAGSIRRAWAQEAGRAALVVVVVVLAVWSWVRVNGPAS